MDSQRGSPVEVFRVFLKLGLTSFGGPVAHLGFFRDELVIRRRWLTEASYAELVALCQFLPGPASSQVGFALGLIRAGWWGAAAAFLAFTLPSAIVLAGLGMVAQDLEAASAQGLLNGLKIVAVAIVAQAVSGMARSLCPDGRRAGIAVAALVVLALYPGPFAMMAVIALGGIGGLALCHGQGQAVTQMPLPVTRRVGLVALAVFAALFLILPLLAPLGHGAEMIDGFYRAGSLVFGGGHVVLPLLETETVGRGWMDRDTFLGGYALAQAVPGPLFTFAAWLGAAGSEAPDGVTGATLATLSLFAPGFLLLVGALPFWSLLRHRPRAQAAVQGANAAVVGVLGLALYDPVFTGGIHDALDVALAVACFVGLTKWNMPPWSVVLIGAVIGMALMT